MIDDPSVSNTNTTGTSNLITGEDYNRKPGTGEETTKRLVDKNPPSTIGKTWPDIFDSRISKLPSSITVIISLYMLSLIITLRYKHETLSDLLYPLAIGTFLNSLYLIHRLVMLIRQKCFGIKNIFKIFSFVTLIIIVFFTVQYLCSNFSITWSSLLDSIEISLQIFFEQDISKPD